jgi:outer membrane receptor protein involved in Fe transport
MKTLNFESLNSIAKYFMLLVCVLMISITGNAQDMGTGEIKISGKVNDEKTGKAVEAATVSAISIVPNSSGQADTLSTLSMTGKDGSFIIRVTSVNNLRLVFTAVGFETKEKKIPIEAGLKEVNAGTFSLINEAKSLANVLVTAKKPLMTLAVDRRIFNADASVTSKGGNAVDVMKNIPSLTVDINGGVQLRNSTPQIFVDGRPTILTLEQIPAEDIDKVEVITNPSARYDAGSTGGIINIILKKNRKAGLNGVASLGVGSPQLFNSSLSLNFRKGKFNLFASGNYNRSGGVAKGNANRQNKSDGIITDYFNQESETDRTRKFGSVRFGADYFINKFNTISISQGIVDGRFGNSETQNQIYADNQAVLTKTGYRLSTDDDFFKRYNSQVNYRRTYDKTGKEWTVDFTYSGGTNGGDGKIYNQLYSPDGQPSGSASIVDNFSTGSGDQFTFQTDYVNPFSEKSKLELGARSFHNISNDKYDVYSIDNGQSTKLPLSNNYRFREMVNAVYANYSNAVGKLKYQGGLRIEQSSFDGQLIDSAQKFGYDYPSKGTDLWNSMFPSLYLTYELSEGNDLQANFSRRIRRPNFWQINPYVDISDPMNIRKGNPALQPEFTNSVELNYNRTYSSGNVLISTYFRNNRADITLYSDTISNAELAQLNNAAIDPNAILTTFINADRTNRTGVEITWQQRIGSSFDFTPNFNAQYRDVKAQVNDINLSNSGFNWNAKLMANYKIKSTSNKIANNFSFQLSGEYQSPRVLPQGKEKEQYSMDFAIRKDLLKNNTGTITFNINDVLNSRRFGSITDTENFYQDSFRRWNVRSFRLTFSYRFGKNNFEFFKRRESGGEEGGSNG